MDIRRQRAILECEAKAEKIALRWFEKNYEKVFKNPQLNPEQIPKNAAKLYDEIVASRKRLVQWTKENEKEMREDRKAVQKTRSIADISEEELTRGPMIPVEQEVKEVLYTGVSHNSEGRAAYLKKRYDLQPHQRFYDPLTFAMDYGWDVRRRAWPAIKEHAKTAIVQNSFYRRTGAIEGDDLERRRPFSSAHVSVEIL